MSQNNPESDESGPMTPGQALLYGLGAIGLGILVFALLAWMESSTTGGRVNWLIALLYKIGGKWTAAGIFFGAGAIFLIIALVRYQRREDE
jgi:hypothetical protein